MADTDTDLSESVTSFEYLVAVPGTFAATYPDTTDDMVTQVLMDAFAEAQLMGLLGTFAMDDGGVVTPALSNGQVALVVIFAAIRFMRIALGNASTSVTYKAGSAEYATSTSALLLRDILSDLNAQKNAIIATLSSGGTVAAGQAFYMADQFLARVAWDFYPTYDFLAIGW